MNQSVLQAGAVVYRRINSEIRILLILSKKRPQVRIFPKGHIEPGETALEASRRELLEEAGIRAECIGSLDEIVYAFREKKFQVQYYLFRYGEAETKGEQGRDPQWFCPEEAQQLLPFDGLKTVLAAALPLCS